MDGRSKKDIVEPMQETHCECGDCERAYGYCWPVMGGVPYFCRCPLHPFTLLRVNRKACLDFGRRSEPRPVKTDVHLSVSRDEGPEPEKVVPLFREGERRPWKVVPVSEIPLGGLSWDGSPVRRVEVKEAMQEDTEW